jgi:type IV pilus assembly protein PilY1
MQYFSRLHRLAFIAMAFWSLGQALPVSAGLLNLSDVPLFLGFRVEPNLIFAIDDSGSMDWETVTRDAANDGRHTGTQPNGTNPAGAGPVQHRDSDDNGSANCGFGTNGQTFNGYLYIAEFEENTYDDDGNDCNTADDQDWRMRNAAFNPLYFNPNRTYTPWAGLDKNGNPFTDMPITAAKANPYDPASETIDLTRHNSNWTGNALTPRATSDRDHKDGVDGFRYYTWTDLDSDGLFDNGEETEHFINQATPDIQKKFANWFSYHRKREYVAKWAYSHVIAEANNVRMGLVTLHNNNSVSTPVKSMNLDPTSGNKKALLDKLYSINSDGDTPLRTTLNNIGRYFECSSSVYSTLFPGQSVTCPVLSQANGGACQQNFVVFMTDGFENGGSPSIGNTDTDGTGTFDGGAYADTYSNTLADVAMHYYERDLHTSLPDNVSKIPGVDEASHQHMVTYTVSFGLNGFLTANPPNTTDPFTWPNPGSSGNSLAKIDDLRHAAFNGRGLYLDASDPNTLFDKLDDALQSIKDRTSSAAAVTLNSGTRSVDSRVYQARFDSGVWSGQLLALPVNENGTLGALTWDAGLVLDGQNFDSGRTILTYNPTMKDGTPFRWAQLDPAQQTALHINKSGVNDGQGEARLNYLRGSRVHEGPGKGKNNYRVRAHVLGDLINSDPFFVGAPPFPDSLGAGYNAFRSSFTGRLPVVYVGGNDGMLHGFNATTGQEVLAYVPYAVFSRLSELTATNYTHRYYVDGSPTVLDAQIGGAWRTVLVEGLRGGGQGVFALDVTNPAAFSESNAANIVLWEFTDASDADLGFTFSQPSIVRMANGKWAAVFGNGYNSSQVDTARGTGRAVLFIVFLEGGLDGVWTAGTDYIKIDTQVGDMTTPNGLSTPTVVDLDGDLTADFVAAGDLRGNVWTFDVRDTSPGAWRAVHTNSSGTPLPLFTAKDANNNVQPITAKPEVGLHPDDLSGFIVYVGTGKYLESSDHTTSSNRQTFYGLWDDLVNVVPGRTTLLQQTVLQELAAFGTRMRVTSNHEIDWATQHGWFIDLPADGERQVSDPVLRSSRIIFTTLIPKTPEETNICEPSGSSWLMELDIRDGSRLEFSAFDFTDDGKFDEDDHVEISTGGSTEKVPVSGIVSQEGILSSPVVQTAGSGGGGGGGGPEGCEDIKYSSGSTGGVQITRNKCDPRDRGRLAWRELR